MTQPEFAKDIAGMCEFHHDFHVHDNRRTWSTFGIGIRADEAALISPTPKKRRKRQSPLNPTLPNRRFEGDPRAHHLVTKVDQKQCTMCKFYHAVARKNGEPVE